MSVKVEKLENNMAKLIIECSAEDFNEAINKAYEKQKKDISMQGFRKGKVPRAMIEKMYGKSIFYEEAVNIIIPTSYRDAVEEAKDVEIVSRPEIEVVQVEAGKPFIYTAKVATKPDVELGEYKGLEYKQEKIEVTDEEIENVIKQEQMKNSKTIKVTDRPVENGDDILLDFHGFVGDEEFEGGKAESYPLSVGSHSFIEGFEEQIVGKNIDEDFDVNVTFPKDYQAENLAGKPAVFKCKVREINGREMPEINDEFASDVSEFDTLEDWKKEIKDNIKKSKEHQAKHQMEDALVEQAVKNSKMDIPDPMVDLQIEQLEMEFRNQIASQGISYEQYMQLTGLDNEKMSEQLKPRALQRIQQSLLLSKIAETENITVSDVELDEELKTIAKQYNLPEDKLDTFFDAASKDQIRQDVKINKAVKIIVDNAKVK